VLIVDVLAHDGLTIEHGSGHRVWDLQRRNKEI
jgi:hypothetical protein